MRMIGAGVDRDALPFREQGSTSKEVPQSGPRLADVVDISAQR